jgi:hypothetical protein
MSYVFLIFEVSRILQEVVPGKLRRTVEGHLRDSDSQFPASLNGDAPFKEV